MARYNVKISDRNRISSPIRLFIRGIL